MGLRYAFRHLFFGNRFHKERLWNTLEDLDARITDLEEENSSETNTLEGLDARITALEEKNSSETPSEDTPSDEPQETGVETGQG